MELRRYLDTLSSHDGSPSGVVCLTREDANDLSELILDLVADLDRERNEAKRYRRCWTAAINGWEDTRGRLADAKIEISRLSRELSDAEAEIDRIEGC